MATLEPVTAPFTVVIDSREQRPFTFEGFRTDSRQRYAPLVVPTVVAGLGQGDYSLLGHEHRMAVERKSLADLYGTLGQGRERFERELQRLHQLEWAMVVVEADWEDILCRPPELSKLNPKTIFRSVIAWMQRYRNVHWWAADGRRAAEAVTLRCLERWHKDHKD